MFVKIYTFPGKNGGEKGGIEKATQEQFQQKLQQVNGMAIGAISQNLGKRGLQLHEHLPPSQDFTPRVWNAEHLSCKSHSS